MTETITALSALAQTSRLAVFRLLMAAGPGGLPAGVVAERLGIAPATLSFHLAQLSRAGLVTSRRESRLIIYAADHARMQAVIDDLTKTCCGGNPELCGIATRLPAPDPAAWAGPGLNDGDR